VLKGKNQSTKYFIATNVIYKDLKSILAILLNNIAYRVSHLASHIINSRSSLGAKSIKLLRNLDKATN
jgi:hypothetical protein